MTRLIVLMLISFPMFLFAQKVEKLSVYFDSDHADLIPLESQKITDFIQTLYNQPITTIETWAYTDEDGKFDYNISLAKRRIETVESLFKNSISTYYQSHPKSEIVGKEDEIKRNNRRVDIAVTIASLKTPQDLANYFIAKERQVFFMKNDTSIVLMGKQGVKFEIEPYTLVFQDGTFPKGQIEVTLKEAFNEDDWMLYGLHTMSDDKILETGGMFNITAKSEGRLLEIQKGKSIKTTIPNEKLDTSMQIFVGENLANGTVNWQPTGEVLVKKKVSTCVSLTKLTTNQLQSLKVAKMQKPILTTANPKALKMTEPELNTGPPSLPRLITIRKWKDYGPFHIGENKAKRKQDKAYKWAYVAYKQDSIRYERHLARFNKKMSIYEKDSVSRRQIAQYLFDLRQYYGTFNIKVLQKTLKDRPSIADKEISILRDKIFKKAEREYRSEFVKYATQNYDSYAFGDAKVYD